MYIVQPQWFFTALGPALNKMLFPIQRPGEYVRADWEYSFFHFNQKKNFNIIFTIFLEKNENKKYFGHPIGPLFRHPLDRKRTFFKGGLV